MKKKAVVLAVMMACAVCACGQNTETGSASPPTVYTRSAVPTVKEQADSAAAQEATDKPVPGTVTQGETDQAGTGTAQTGTGTAQTGTGMTDVEVVPTDTTQQMSTIFNESLTSMLKPMDAAMVATRVTGIDYDPENDISVWTTIYYYMALYGPLARGTGYTENNEFLYAGQDVIREVGRIIYGENYTLPPIPEQIQRISVHDDGKYYVKMDPRPYGYPIFCSAVKNGDGTYEAVAQIVSEHGEILSTQSFHFIPKTETNALLGESYAYTIGSLGAG